MECFPVRQTLDVNEQKIQVKKFIFSTSVSGIGITGLVQGQRGC